jgi:hypothetical protein
MMMQEQQVSPEEQQMLAQQQGTMLPDQNSGIPSPQDAASQAQAQEAQVSADQQMLAQNGNPYAQQEGAPQEQAASNQEGMNPSIDPAILDTLSQLKDSSIMDASIISMLANSESISSVIEEHSGEILSGASAVGRILLNAMTKKNAIILEIGEKKYKQLSKNLRTVFVKMSDLYADILKMELESDGKMEN